MDAHSIVYLILLIMCVVSLTYDEGINYIYSLIMVLFLIYVLLISVSYMFPDKVYPIMNQYSSDIANWESHTLIQIMFGVSIISLIPLLKKLFYLIFS